MKEMMKRITALILCAVLLLGQVAMGAEASDVSSVITESFTHINPLYADQITEQDLVDVAPLVYAFDPADYVTSLEAAGTALREQLKKRELSCTVYIRVNSYTDKLHETVFSEAIKHTGNPTEGDYLKWVYAGYKGKVSVIDSNGYSYVTFTYNMTYYTSAQQEATMDAAVTKLLNDLNLYSASDYNKVRGIYDYICANIVYDYDNLNDSNYTLKHTAYAALINKKAVCQGYALLFYRLSLSLGVDCRLVSGIGNGGPHGWNIVKLGDLYYCLDSTWDAVRNPYEFFLKCEANFGDHHLEDDWAKLGYNISKTDYNPSSDEPNASHKHEMGDWSIGTNATCTTDGFKIRYCKKSGCDYSETDPIVAAGHSWVAATCTVPKTCSVCDATDGTTIPHVYDQEIEDPNYQAGEGTYYKSCKCGKKGTETFTVALEVTCGTPAKQIYNAMIALKSQYPEGMRWTNDNYYAWNGGYFSGGYGCAGFAFMLSDAAFGSLPNRRITEDITIDDIRVGDILRINNNTHSVIVLEVFENYVVIAEGNYNSSIHWGRTLTAKEIASKTDYIMTRYPEHRWTEGNCLNPRTCQTCGAQDHAPGHSWVDATCTDPKTCSVCDATDGTTIPHVYDQEIVDPKYLVSEATTTSRAVYRKSCKCGAAGEETFTAGELKPSVGDGKLPQLGSATNLTWGTEHGWNWDNNDIPYHDPSYDIALPGVASFKRASLDQGYYEIVLYKVGQKDAIAHSSWQNDGYSTEWIDKYFVHHINESGDYYFTVTALGDGTNYADGPTVVSDTWHYVKPAKALKTATQLGWDWPEATFNVADNKSKVFGASVKIYYTDDLNVEPEWEGTSTYFYYTDRIDVEWLASDSGNGYYSFQVMLLSSDLNTTANSGWSAMSPTYKLGAGGNDCSTLGHNWQDATCTTPKTCSVCGITSGSALGHDWNAATCTTPKTCKTCGMTDGTTIPHVYDQEVADPKYLVKEATQTEQAIYWKSCVCGKAGTETFKHGNLKPQDFKDVPKNAYYYDGVMWAVENGVTTGTGAGTFSPDAICSRAQVVTFLWRAAGEPEPKSTVNPFKDVKSYDYFYKAVLWALEKGITTGTGDGTTFEPNKNCNRGQIVTFLCRAKNGVPYSNQNPFKDVSASSFFYNPVLWAVQNGITTGTGDGTTFAPNADCTRGQVITFLYRAYK